MLLKPDLGSAMIDPFYQQTTLCLFCDVLNPDTGEPYNRDPRGMARKALAYVQSSGVGDTVYFGPEAEFFVFDDVRWSTAAHDTGYSFDSTELPANTNRAYPEGNMGHRPTSKGGYFPVNPIDSAQDLRGEMLAVMGELGMEPEKHHHEVAPAQHELGLKFSDLLTMAKAERPDFVRPRPVDDPNVRCPDISRAREVFGWAPPVNENDTFRALRTVLDSALKVTDCSMLYTAHGSAAPWLRNSRPSCQTEPRSRPPNSSCPAQGSR